MKSLVKYIDEKLLINKNYTDGYNYHPKDKKELKTVIEELYANNIYDLNDIDVSNITDFSYIFYEDENTGNKDFDVSKWDVSNGTDFTSMFYGCPKFNCNLSEWNISNGEYFFLDVWTL